MEFVMASKIIKIFLGLFIFFSINADAGLIVTGLNTAGLAYNTTSTVGPGCFTNGSTCVSNPDCCSTNCSSHVCADIPPPVVGNYNIVLALGDSHVLGQTAVPALYRGGFRFRLQQELRPDVIINMVGPIKSNPASDAVYDVDHAGIGGQTTAQINSRVPALITGYLSAATCAHTVVVLEGGYNKMSVTEPGITQQINEIKQSIQRFHDFCPAMPVIFMNLKPFPSITAPSINANIDTFNARLLTEMSILQSTIPNLWIEDRHAIYKDPANCGGNPDNCCTIKVSGCDSNNINCTAATSHPNGTGYELDGHYLGLIIKNGCLSQYHCRPDPLP